METDRLIIRNFKKEDIHDYSEIFDNRNLQRCEVEMNIMVGNIGYYVLELKDTHKVIGTFIYQTKPFNAKEIYIAINPNYRHMYYASEALDAFIKKAKEENIQTLMVSITEENEANKGFLNCYGFKLSATHNKHKVINKVDYILKTTIYNLDLNNKNISNYS